MQRLAALFVNSLNFAQVPARAMRPEHQRHPNRDLNRARNLIPMSANQQDNSTNHQHRADERKNRQGFARLFLELEMLDDLPLLLGANQPGLLDFFDVGIFHNSRYKNF